MATGALGTSAAHPLYLYVVFVACVVGAIALLISGWVSHRRSAWPRYWQTQSTQLAETRPQPAYPTEPAPVTIVLPEATASVPAATEPAAPKKTAARKSATATATRTPAKKTAAAKKTTAKKTTPRKTTN